MMGNWECGMILDVNPDIKCVWGLVGGDVCGMGWNSGKTRRDNITKGTSLRCQSNRLVLPRCCPSPGPNFRRLAYAALGKLPSINRAFMERNPHRLGPYLPQQGHRHMGTGLSRLALSMEQVTWNEGCSGPLYGVDIHD